MLPVKSSDVADNTLQLYPSDMFVGLVVCVCAR
jgi:hypothetical protein